VDTALDQNQTELRVLVLPVPLQMLAHSDSLLDQVVEILWDLRAQTCRDQSTSTISCNSSSTPTQNPSHRPLVLPCAYGRVVYHEQPRTAHCSSHRTSQCGIQKVQKQGPEALPWPLRMRSTLLPVTLLTWAIPCESLRITPI
jgi:hypothetical protein